MGFFDWIGSIGKKKFDVHDMVIVEKLTAEILYKKLAIESCIDIIANSILRAEFFTYEKGKKKRSKLYYLLNVQPNKNQNQKEFLKGIIRRLIYQNECLVVQWKDQFWIADTFVREERMLIDTYYTGVTVGDFVFNKNFAEQDVFYFKYNEKNIRKIIDGVYESYGKLLTASMNIYKRSNAKRYVLEGDFVRSQSNESQKRVDEMMNNQIKPWLEADNAGALYNLQKNYELKGDPNTNSKSAAGSSSEDIRKMVDSIFYLVGSAFHVPTGLIKGETVELSGQTDSMLMFMSFPLLEIIEAEMNRKLYTETEYLERTYMKVDKNKIRSLSIKDLAPALDKFFQIGAFSIDDVMEFIGMEPFEEEWSQRRYVTKNYADAKSEFLKGGEANGESTNST